MKTRKYNQRELNLLGQHVAEGTPLGTVLALIQSRVRTGRLRIPHDMTKADWTKRVFCLYGVKPSPERNEALLLWERMKGR